MTGQDLKNSILQLAIQGKLVPQDANDEPASVLLERIKAEKQKLINEKKIKKEKPLPEITDEEKPFEIPESWEWVRLGEIASFLNGDRSKNYPNKAEYVSEGIPWINTGHILANGFLSVDSMNYITENKYNSLSSGKIQKGDLVYCLRGATYGKVSRVEPFEKGAIASSLMIIRLFNLDLREYLYVYLKSKLSKDILLSYANGAAQPNLAAKDVAKFFLPLPPLSEQKRIVAKIEELMPLVDEYDKAQKELDALNAKLPDALKKSILQEAIQGKLVPQDQNDEPASVLLQRIRKEKEQLVKDGKLKKKDLVTTPITDEEKPFEIPEGWVWCRLGEIGEYKKGPFGSSLTKAMFVPKSNHSIKVYEQKNAIQKDYTLGNYYITKEKYQTMEGFTILPGDIIVSCAGTIGETYQIPEHAPIGIINQALMRVRLYNTSMTNYWRLFFADMLNHNTAMKGAGSAIKNIPPFEVLKKILIPLPPLAEQHRIVSKIEDLFAQIEPLAKALSTPM